MKGRFNLFQCAMLRWRALHPYNAVHVLAISSPFDDKRLRSAIADVLEACGLTGFALDERRRRFEFAGGPPEVEVEQVTAAAEPLAAVSREIEQRINASFPRSGRYNPFRFFVVPAGAEFHLGLAYDHPIAGGDSIALLLTDIADRYAAAGEASPPPPRLDCHPATYSALFQRQASAVLHGLSSLPAVIANGRRTVRPRVADPANGRNGFHQFAIAGEDYARLRGAAGAWSISVNDLLLAIVLKALAALAPERQRGGRRTLAAAASIVNLRSDFMPPADRTFGQFLSSFRVAHAVPAGTALRQFASEVHEQTARARRRKLYLQTLLVMGATSIAWRFLDLRRRQRFYFKYHPILAGVTPLNVNAIRRHGSCTDGCYLRAASTGPLAPMVFATTTSGSVIRIGITFRVAAVSRESVESIVNSICHELNSLP